MSKNTSSGATSVGIIGCGMVSAAYLKNSRKFSAFDIIAVADQRPDAAQDRSNEFGINKACSVDEILDDPAIEMIINLTPHSAHGPVALSVLEAEKHVYNEKPMAVHLEEGQSMLSLANKKGLYIGCGPDTFFGGAWQTARQFIDAGNIGQPVAASACLMAFRQPQIANTTAKSTEYVNFYRTNFYDFGVTWSFDRGPYYLNALIHLLGPIRRVTASTRNVWGEKREFKDVVKTPTHFAGIMDFHSGVVGTILVSSDVHSTNLPHIEIYGTEGSLRCIDPNNFGGPIYFRPSSKNEFVEVECNYSYNQNSRGVGVADMAKSVRNQRPIRASGEMGYHVIEVIHALHQASAEGQHIELSSTCLQPQPLPLGLSDWEIDDQG